MALKKLRLPLILIALVGQLHAVNLPTTGATTISMNQLKFARQWEKACSLMGLTLLGTADAQSAASANQ